MVEGTENAVSSGKGHTLVGKREQYATTLDSVVANITLLVENEDRSAKVEKELKTADELLEKLINLTTKITESELPEATVASDWLIGKRGSVDPELAKARVYVAQGQGGTEKPSTGASGNTPTVAGSNPPSRARSAPPTKSSNGRAAR